MASRLQYAHVISLGLVVLSILFLMSLPAYHRLVDEGADTEDFHRYASLILLLALAQLAAGLSVDLYVVVRLVSGRELVGIVAGAACFTVSLVLWYGRTTIRRLSSST